MLQPSAFRITSARADATSHKDAWSQPAAYRNATRQAGRLLTHPIPKHGLAREQTRTKKIYEEQMHLIWPLSSLYLVVGCFRSAPRQI